MANNPTSKDKTSDNMWNESATRAIDFVIFPTISSTKKKEQVKVRVHRRRNVLPDKKWGAILEKKWESEEKKKKKNKKKVWSKNKNKHKNKKNNDRKSS